MPSFAQTHSRVTSYYVLQDKQDILQQLVHAARWKKPVLIVPALASEFTDPENRPVFENIVEELASAKYLAHVIFGLDQASEQDVRTCIAICQKGGLKNYLIQWNDGPAVSGIYKMLEEDGGFDLSRRGKGRNVFMGFGVAMALGATCVGLLGRGHQDLPAPPAGPPFLPGSSTQLPVFQGLLRTLERPAPLRKGQAPALGPPAAVAKAQVQRGQRRKDAPAGGLPVEL